MSPKGTYKVSLHRRIELHWGHLGCVEAVMLTDLLGFGFVRFECITVDVFGRLYSKPLSWIFVYTFISPQPLVRYYDTMRTLLFSSLPFYSPVFFFFFFFAHASCFIQMPCSIIKPLINLWTIGFLSLDLF